jgi:excisionase family DNA binding protein
MATSSSAKKGNRRRRQRRVTLPEQSRSHEPGICTDCGARLLLRPHDPRCRALPREPCRIRRLALTQGEARLEELLEVCTRRAFKGLDREREGSDVMPLSPKDPSVLKEREHPFMLTAEEVARDFLRTSRKSVYEMARMGRLPGAVRIGRKVLFRRDTLLHFLRERESSVSSLEVENE